MAGRPGSTFSKRQREQKLIERRNEKTARKEQRKVDKENGIVTDDIAPLGTSGFNMEEGEDPNLFPDHEPNTPSI
jgi:hypothetical protein